MDAEALAQQRINVSARAKVLSVSTRSVGFASEWIMIKLNQIMENIPQCSVYELYRVSLVQLECKM